MSFWSDKNLCPARKILEISENQREPNSVNKVVAEANSYFNSLILAITVTLVGIDFYELKTCSLSLNILVQLIRKDSLSFWKIIDHQNLMPSSCQPILRLLLSLEPSNQVLVVALIAVLSLMYSKEARFHHCFLILSNKLFVRWTLYFQCCQLIDGTFKLNILHISTTYLEANQLSFVQCLLYLIEKVFSISL